MKKNIRIALFIPLFLLFTINAGASWLIDPEKFSASVHGEISCRECHEAITEKDLHPDPANVSMKLSEFFSVEMCENCHDDILDTMNEGRHGSKSVNNPEGWKYCIQCHNPHYQLPAGIKTTGNREGMDTEFSEEDRACLECHGADKADDPKNAKQIAQFCFHCHAEAGTDAQKLTGRIVPLIDIETYHSAEHAKLNCLVCHPRAPAFEHNTQIPADCRQCHLPHDEKVAHDIHANVSCQSCHLKDIKPVKNAETGRILWESKRILDSPLKIHEMVNEMGTSGCRNCHTKDNEVGAAAMVLPAKSLICMPCHTATISIGDTTTVISLLIFLFGSFSLFSYILSGALPNSNDSGLLPKFFVFVGRGIKVVFSSKIVIIIKSVVADVLLQQRLFGQSASRWFIHSMIFFPFVFRFLWGIVALVASLWNPESQLIRFMLDKNHPATGFLFDLTGMIILMGIVPAFFRKAGRPERPQGLPDQDRIALALIGGIVLIGFILEGLRIAMTGFPDGTAYAFIGVNIGKLFDGFSNIGNFYGYVWYFHAIITGAFVAYLPFSHLLHIIMAPIVLTMRAVAESEHEKGHK